MNKTQVKINAQVIDENAKKQIELMAKSPAFRGLISIMPDAHPGKGSVIGFTGKFNKCVIPNVIGVDIGCGVASYPLGNIDIDFEKLDEYIRKVIPLGFNSQKLARDWVTNVDEDIKHEILTNITKITHMALGQNLTIKDPELQMGTLGGGNHFIEIDADEKGNKYLTIHTGSRNLGLRVANYYQNEAKEFQKGILDYSVEKDLEYLPLKYGGDSYLRIMRLAQQYASHNRRVIIINILKYFGIDYEEENVIESVHNYISEKDNVVRKGAISAHQGEKVIIPLNMRDGIIIGTGKGINSFNNSAPHGAGRLFGRNQMQRRLASGEVTMQGFKDEMKDVYSTSVKEQTIDESPYAYKPYTVIEKELKETVEVEVIMKPIYNLKADD